MTEIKDLLMKILEESPDIAIWVLVIIYAYKIVFVGTIYGTLRFAISKICQTVTDNRSAKLKAPQRWRLGNEILINEAAKSEMDGLLRLVRSDSGYVHQSDVRKLRRAWEESVKNRG